MCGRWRLLAIVSQWQLMATPALLGTPLRIAVAYQMHRQPIRYVPNLSLRQPVVVAGDSSGLVRRFSRH